MSEGRRTRAAGRLLLAASLLGCAAVFAGSHRLALVVGGSMSPALEPGDVCIVRRGASKVEVGDVVLLARPGWSGGVLHRVVALTPAGALRTRGDANPVCDRDPAARDAVLGEVVAVLRVGGAVRWFGQMAGGTLCHQTQTARR
ncbi:MAG: signal peptidase I [Coriobacteriaceae bacterium]|nr:signal peptidase I [Coriobacteriaceae bacterium]